MAEEAFKLNYRNSRSWVAYSKDDATCIKQIQSEDHGVKAEIGIWLRGTFRSRDYVSFAEARAREKKNPRLLKELSAVESIIKERGGEIF